LRFKITNKGKSITPLLCERSDPKFDIYIQLAKKMIDELKQSSSMREAKGALMKKIASLESIYDDYKLVRGFYALLERRCTYDYSYILSDMDYIPNNKSGKMNNFVASYNSAFENKNVPFYIRKMLFELGSERGLPLTDIDRNEIVNTVAAKMGTSAEVVSNLMWNDQEENLLLEKFEPITPEGLIAWYNLSLVQTLLFNCIKLEFSLNGGTNWKYALRAVKRLGLMYNLESRTYTDEKSASGDISRTIQNNDHTESDNEDSIICSIDGPLSIFKLTDRYGTSIARLIPLITSLTSWSLKAWIVRKTLSLGKKIYEFEMSDTSSYLLAEPKLNSTESRSEDTSGSDYFDSNVEKKFATRFLQSVSDWKLIREPDPLILQNGKAMIPDFVFEKYDQKIYLEIIGFWTKEYLLRKVQKLKAITGIANSSRRNKIDLLIAINHDVYASSSSNLAETRAWNSLVSSITDKRLIVYNNQNIPLKPILDYLRCIDQEHAKNLKANELTHIVDELFQAMSNHSEVISITALAKAWNIESDTLLEIIQSQAQNKDRLGNYFIVDKYLISDRKLKKLKDLIDNTDSLSEVNSILGKNDIPESCLLDIISKLGFDVIWHGMDSSRASLRKKLSS
jgi:predicted nuclease of restriction endonuclease-like RecB superfamily